MSSAIKVHGLGKTYRLGQRQAYGSLRDSIAKAFSATRGSRRTAAEARQLWALKDVSFEIPHGAILGIIGRNGSGKSTLLKILSRITEPSTGWAEVRGRVGSLLEVGTGFHPELTGRENVFVNGAILGMGRAEVTRKFDEIVAFADLDRFIDTPVKHYSSGMYMRLAFSVAAHLEPEILLVDEVLAVGDLAFQRKCLGKMDDVSRQGRTILFVSHQMNQLRRLCHRCLWLDGGRLIDDGSTNDIVNRYEASFMEQPTVVVDSAGGTGFLGWTLGESESQQYTLTTFGPVVVRFFIRVRDPIRNAHHGLALRNADGTVIWGVGTDNLDLDSGLHEIAYRLDSLPLKPGAYRWLATLYKDGQELDRMECIPELSIETPPLAHRQDEWAGVVNLPYTVTFSRATSGHTLSEGAAKPHEVLRV